MGQGGRLFRIIKFRSMRTRRRERDRPDLGLDHDSRCTRIGDWLRHTNIDELPQLFNVMQAVRWAWSGPGRNDPASSRSSAGPIPDYDLRHAVPGGMTGWAQVHGWRGRTSLRKRVQYDLDYIERWSHRAGPAHHAHDDPACLLGQDIVERIEAAGKDERLTERATRPATRPASAPPLFDRDPDL